MKLSYTFLFFILFGAASRLATADLTVTGTLLAQLFAATTGSDADFQKATHTIHRSARYPSHLELSVMPR